jgi:hypothetical protein
VKGSGQWRELGARLAISLGHSNSRGLSHGAITTPARLQGLVADLAAEHQNLLLPLKDLVTRPAFQALIPKALSGSGAVQRDVLIQDMEATFSQQVIAALAELLDGFLDLPPGSAEAQPPAPPPPAPGPPAPAPTPAPPAPPAPPASAPPPPPAASVAAAQPQPGPVWPDQPAPPARASAPARPAESGIPVLRLALLSLVTAIAVAAGLVALRSTELCSLVGLCAGGQVASHAAQALEAAEQAAQDLRQANSLRAYERALAELERHLLVLTTARLTPQQTERLQQLDQAAREARDVLADERNDGRRLERVAQALSSARQSTGEEQAALLAAANDELDAIPPRSFSAAEAKRLRRQLEQLARAALVAEPVPPEEAGESPADDGSASPQDPATPPPSTAPAPPLPQPPPPPLPPLPSPDPAADSVP